ncbi:hypothetical protein [Actinomyces capricornis]|uniref:Uncharacterized protein n=1 Tax=Actinomyces capricornis TaxID=2755559 RepID=A0ABM7UBH9_9ACTO|nr:hypothetical protein [Actinomyces capricornis]BDA64616.1 hypothetical protein MANAM107_14500 [Actinomyces capricornis]
MAIEAVEDRVTLSRTNLSLWSSSSSGAISDTVDDGLAEEVWSSPVADDYRSKISTRVGAVDTILSTLTQDITSAKNAIIYSGLEYVDKDSPEAQWPRS